MSERLHDHRVRWHLRGLPIFGRGRDVDGYDEDEIVGYTAEPEWHWADLTSEERAIIETDAALLVMESTERTPDKPVTADFAMAYTLDHNGIACFHRWTSTDDSRGVPFMRSCSMCMASQPLPGEVYRVGDGWMRLTERPPTLLIPRVSKPVAWMNDPHPSPVSPTLEYDEYRWNGRAYVPA